VEVKQKPIQRRSHWHLVYIESIKKGAKVYSAKGRKKKYKNIITNHTPICEITNDRVRDEKELGENQKED